MDIILVDDSFSARRALQTILETRGCTVRSFADIEGGLQSFDAEGADAIFCDLVLQDEDGVAMRRSMRDRPGGHRVPFVLISGLIDDKVRARAEREGIRWLLVKPFSMTAVEEIVEGIRAQLAAAAEQAAEAEGAERPAPDVSAMDLRLAKGLFHDLSGLQDIDEIAVFSEPGDLVLASAETLTPELRTWQDNVRTLFPSTDRTPGENVVAEASGKVWIAMDLVDGQRLVCSMGRFSAVGPIRFFALRRLANLPPALSPEPSHTVEGGAQ